MNFTFNKKKKGMKKYLFSTLLIGLLSVSSVKAVDNLFVTNVVTGGAAAQTFVLLTNRTLLKSITISGGANQATVRFFDENRNTAPQWGTNVVVPLHITVASYATNINTTNISETGYTNIMTNSYIYTYNVTNSAATNALNPIAAIASAANETATLDNISALGTRGIVAQCNTNVTIILRYTSGQ